MPRPQSPDLHGSAPDRLETALLIIDALNPMDFEDSEGLIKRAVPAAERIAALKSDLRAKGVPAIYVNDNFGRWRSNLESIVEHCVADECPGREVARRLIPDKDDYFVLKPKHSGFYATTLEVLLRHLGSERLILTGFAGNICVLFTAHDAHMRDFRLWVPSDCTASNTDEDDRFAIEQIRRVLGAETATSSETLTRARPDAFELWPETNPNRPKERFSREEEAPALQ